MKKYILILSIFTFCMQQLHAQNCPIMVNADTHHLLNDTTITIPSSNYVPRSYMPCHQLIYDSAITVIDTIYLRSGTTFIADSLSTLFGGFIIYAEAGSTIDFNFKASILLYYTPTTILIDTPNASFTKIQCSNITFDYSNMLESHNCNASAAATQMEIANQILVINDGIAWQIQNNGVTTNATVEVFDLQGRQICKPISFARQTRIPYSHLSKGIYIFRYNIQDKIFTQKVMAQ